MGEATNEPIPMLLYCPECKARHIDEPPFDKKPHDTHSCQSCGLTWKPAKVNTVGVRFLPGYKNEPQPNLSTPVIEGMVELQMLCKDVRKAVSVPGRSHSMEDILEGQQAEREIIKKLPQFLDKLQTFLIASES